MYVCVYILWAINYFRAKIPLNDQPSFYVSDSRLFPSIRKYSWLPSLIFACQRDCTTFALHSDSHFECWFSSCRLYTIHNIPLNFILYILISFELYLYNICKTQNAWFHFKNTSCKWPHLIDVMWIEIKVLQQNENYLLVVRTSGGKSQPRKFSHIFILHFHITTIIFVQIWIKNFVFWLLSKCLP